MVEWMSSIVSRTQHLENIAVSVVIPVFNGASTIGAELAALEAQKTSEPFEVVIADNGSTDGTQEVAQQWSSKFAAFTVVDASQRRGVSHARNEGARAALGKKVLICDADDVVCPEWVGALAESLETYDAVGGAARLDRLNPPEVVGQDPVLTPGLNRMFGFFPYALGGSFGVKREVLVSLRGFDASFLKGHEEADFCWRLQLAGYSLGWRADAVVDYRQRPDHMGAAKQAFHFARSSILLWCRYAEKHPLTPVSLRSSIRGLGRQLVRSHRLARVGTRRDQAKALGWSAGLLAGHYRYRIRREVPPPLLMD